jgi:hypothetical protein
MLGQQFDNAAPGGVGKGCEWVHDQIINQLLN